MSSTNRKRNGEPAPGRSKADQYLTPQEVADACCARLVEDGWVRRRSLVLEPSAGTGAFVRAAARIFAPAYLHANEPFLTMDPDAVPEKGKGTLTLQCFEELSKQHPDLGPYDSVIGNPPFSLAEEHIRIAHSMLAVGGVLAFVLRLNFLGSTKRAGLWHDHPPDAIYTLEPRPSFTGGGNDSTEYALFVWRNARVMGQAIDWIRWGRDE